MPDSSPHSVRELLDEELRCIEPISVAIGESCGECVPCQARAALRSLEEQLGSRERELFGTGTALANADRATEELTKRIAELEEQLEAAEKALAFYGDPETYFAISFLPDRPCGEFEDDFEELDGALGHPDGGSWVKPGKRARAYFKDAYPASEPKP